MAGEPIFGGDGIVALLDWGQPGGTLHTAGTVQSVNKLLMGSKALIASDVTLPEQDQTFREILGFEGRPVVVEGTMRATTDANMNAIEANIEARIDGTRHNENGSRSRTPQTMIDAQPTSLTDKFGRVIGSRVSLRNYERIGKRSRNPQWAAVQQFRIVFEVME